MIASKFRFIVWIRETNSNSAEYHNNAKDNTKNTVPMDPKGHSLEFGLRREVGVCGCVLCIVFNEFLPWYP